MLPKNYRFHIVNNTSVTLDFSSNSANEKVDLDFLKWKRSSTGAIEYDSGGETNLAYTSGDVVDGGSAEFTAQDNSSDLFDGLFGRLTVQTDNASAVGRVDLWVEFTSDGGTVWPSDAADFDPEEDLLFLGSLQMGGAETRSMPFSFDLPG